MTHPFNIFLTDHNPHQLEGLAMSGRVFVTEAWFFWQEAELFGLIPLQFYTKYQGAIITQTPKSFEEAEKIALERGYGEKVLGVFVQEIVKQEG